MRFFAFILKAKTNNHYHITLKITELNGTIKFIETPLIILPEEWDVVKLCPNNLYNEKSKILNKKLNRIKIYIANYFKDLEKTGKAVSTNLLNKSIKKICENSSIDFKPETLLFYMYSYIKEREYTVAVST